MGESSTSPPDYSAIHRVVSDYVKSGGKRVHFWDHNHSSPIPLEIFGDPKLLDTVRAAGGTPSYIMEDTASGINEWLSLYRDSTPQIREKMMGEIRANAETYSPKDPVRYANAEISILENARIQNFPLYSPDTRVKLNKGYTPSETAMLEEVIKPTIFSASADCLPIVAQTIFSNPIMNQEELVIAKSTIKKFSNYANANGTFDSGELDKKIADNILNHAAREDAPKNEVQLVIYGIDHYEKAQDINENIPGLSIAIVADAAAIKASKASLSAKPLSSLSLPDYAYYGQSNTLVKLDNDAAKAAYLGVDDTTFQALKSNHQKVIPIEEEKLSPKDEAACKAEAETLIGANIKEFRDTMAALAAPPAFPATKNSQTPGHTRP